MGTKTRRRHQLRNPRECRIDGCCRPETVRSAQLCNLHYQRFWKHGDPLRNPRNERRTLTERFWEKVDRRDHDECWEWTARSNVRGYGYLQRGGRNGGRILAHRLSWELHHGPIPEGMHVCHRCDNPPCVNPAHLFLGTAGDNHADSVSKGRAKFTFSARPQLIRGVANNHAKLTEAQIREIRALRVAGWTQARIAKRFGVTRQNVRCIVNNVTWRHVA